MLRFLLCLPATAITFTAIAGEVDRQSPAPAVDASRAFVGMTTPAASEVADFTIGDREAHRSADGLFRVNALVNGARINFIVDTGSSVVVLTREDARRVGLADIDAPRLDVATANGASSMRMTVIRDLRVGRDRLKGVRAAIVDEGLPTSLLGQSALAKLGSLSIRDGKLSIGS